jgi:biopolymer transport protein TolR
MPALLSRTSKRPLSEINVVPLVDVMLVLLVIFMITTPLMTQSVQVDLPKTTLQALSSEEKEPLVVTVDAAGNFYLNVSDKPEQPITAHTLQFLVTRQLQLSNNGKRPVLVRGDKHVNYGKVVEVMALLRNAGVQGVGLMTDPLPT